MAKKKGFLDRLGDAIDAVREGGSGSASRYRDRDTATIKAREQRVQRQLEHHGQKCQKVRGEDLYEIVNLDGTRSSELRGMPPLSLEELEDHFDMY